MENPKFFATPAHWRKWLERNHLKKQELLVGFHKKDSGKPSITWPESVDAALCSGWIDGVRRRIDDTSYSIRFSQRCPNSVWSAINIKRVEDLTAQGLMHPSGVKAFEARKEARSRIYAFEQDLVHLSPEQEERFRANEAAWKYFQSKPPWYRRTSTWWVISAKREETRNRRLAALIKASEEGRGIDQLAR